MWYHNIATSAAARRQRGEAEAEEEETMTSYDQEPSGQEWEYKIVRANSPIFAQAEVFQQLIREEAQAGWTLVEKFDNARVRFRRPVFERSRDATRTTKMDPYRTQFNGANSFVIAAGITIIIFIVLIFFILIQNI